MALRTPVVAAAAERRGASYRSPRTLNEDGLGVANLGLLQTKRTHRRLPRSFVLVTHVPSRQSGSGRR